MKRLAAAFAVLAFAACQGGPDFVGVTPGGKPAPVKSVSSAGTSDGGGQADAGDAGQLGDGGFDGDGGLGGGDGGAHGNLDGGSLACNPASSICPSNAYCACGDPTNNTSCFCYSGEQGEPCAAGGAQCKSPGTCRWNSGFFWGKCGTGTTSGDVCDSLSFSCTQPLTCGTSNCAWGNCCE
jgi:hypothetical protein